MKELIVSILRDAIEQARAAGQLTAEIPSIGIEAPRDPAHGDIASNIALTLAKPERKAPRAIAEIIKAHVALPAEVSEVSVAGPGFINFKMSPVILALRDAPSRECRCRVLETARMEATRSETARKCKSNFSPPIPPAP